MPDLEKPSTVDSASARDVREVQYTASGNLASILEQLNISLLVSTYQAGKLVSVGAHGGQLRFSFHSFGQVMGVAVGKDRIAVGAQRQIHFLKSANDVAPQLEPAGEFDSCWLDRTAFTTGRIHGHDLAWGSDGLWVVNTLFSCLCTLSSEYNFIPRWRPPFVSALIDQDRCHLNGMAMQDGVPRFVTVLAESDEPAGWRVVKATGGAIVDVASGSTILRELCMPHSPRLHQGQLWVLNSGKGEIGQVDVGEGRYQSVATLPGYTRGLSFSGDLAFVGLSRIRETNIFGGLPICEHHEDLQCGVAVVDIQSGRTIATLQFQSGVEEVFAVEVIANSRNPKLRGPALDEDDDHEIWIVPTNASPIPEAGGFNRKPTAFNKNITPRESTASVSRPSIQPQTTADGGSRDVSKLLKLGTAAHQQGDLDQALELFQQAAQAKPQSAEVHNLLGNLYQDLNHPDEAIQSYRRAIQIDVDYAPAHQNLGVLCAADNQPIEALKHYEQAQRLRPSAMNMVLGATMLPVVYDSTEQLNYWRDRLEKRVSDLVQGNVIVDTTNATIPSSFNFAYHGRNDRPIMQNLAKVYRGVECCRAAKTGSWRPKRSRPRVGFLSAHFCNHTIGRLNVGIVEQISKSEFEPVVIALRNHEDDFSHRFRRAAANYVVVPRSARAAREMIADLDLDVLIFADVGMDSLTQTLCYSRMAPIQAVIWGHPDTTGSPTMDYFLSSELAESPEADDHYSEQLVRLETLGVYYERPELAGPQRGRDYFGLEADSHLYLCPQTLFKFHPAFDAMLGGILEADPKGELAMIVASKPGWTAALQARWQRTMPDVLSRVRFLPSMPHRDFLQLLNLGDVMLDTYPFGGGNTTYEALSLGLPVVTLPSDFLRGRLTLAMHRRMNMDQTVAGSPEQYVAMAVALGADPALNQQVRQAIRQSNQILFDNREDVSVFEKKLHSLID